MESPQASPLICLCLCLSAALFFGATPAESTTNVTRILDKDGQYSILIRLLNVTQTGTQLANELNNSNQGLTFFAPTDAAFKNLPSGFLNSLTQEQQVKLVLYHVLSKFYTWDDFRTVNNPVISEASGPNGPYGLNFTFIDDQKVNVSFGKAETTFTTALNLTKPLAVYQVDKVFFPVDKFSDKVAPSPSRQPPAKNETAIPKVPTTKKSGSSSSSGSSRIHGVWIFEGSFLAILGLTSIGLLM